MTGLFLTFLKIFGINKIGKYTDHNFWEKNNTILGEKMQFLVKLGKFTFQIGIFLLGNAYGQLGFFFSQLGKKFGTGNWTQFCIGEKALQDI